MSSENNLSSTFSYLTENLQAVIEQLKDGSSTRPDAPDFQFESFWTRMGTCVKAISQEATKLCLACSEPPLPSPLVLQPLIDGIERCSLALVSAYYSLPPSQGLTLRKLVTNSVVELISALQTLIVSLNTSDVAKSKRHLQSTGSVWEICDKFPGLPRDNKEAVIFQAKETLELISDALEELEESLKGSHNDLDQMLNSCSVDDDEDDISPKIWCDSDRHVVTASVGVIKTAKAMMKKLIKVIDTSGRCDTLDVVAQLDDFANVVSTMSPAVDDFVLSLYPPVKTDAVSINSQHLISVLRHLLSLSKNSHFIASADSTWFEFLDKAVDHNATKTAEVIASLQ